MNPTSYRLGPTRTPRPLKFLLLATFFTSLVCALFPASGLEELLGISAWGVEHFFLWQFFSYLFVHPATHGVSFSFLVSLSFNLYLLWIIGTSLIERRGIFSFFTLYFASGVFVGIFLFLLQLYVGSSFLFSGNTPSLYAILLAWIMLHPDAQLLFLFALPIKAKWLVLTILGANFFIDLSTGEWMNSCANLGGAFFGYLYPLLTWKVHGPFLKLHALEEKLFRLLGAKPAVESSRSKIYDFKTGRAILSDEEFLEEMLSKISQHGKGSLTWRERFRLKRISKRKKKNQPGS